MRIAVVGPSHPFKGGIAQQTTVLARQLVDAGHEVQLVSWLRQYPQRLYPGEQTVRQREFPPVEPTHRVLSWNRPDTWLSAGRRLRAMDLVILAHTTAVQAIPYRVIIAALRGHARVAVICHNVLPHERGRFDVGLVTGLLDAADLAVVHSTEQRAVAAGLSATPTATVPLAPASPAGFTRRTPEPGEHRRLLFFGLVRPYKGLDVLLRALALGPSDVRLRVAGEFWGGTGETEQLVRHLGIADRVELRDGYVPAAEVPGLFADVDALVLPYREVTGSQLVWTAFEFGVPVIATRTGALVEQIRPGVDGLLAQPGSVGSLAAALEEFYRPGVATTMRAAVRPADPQPMWDRYVQAVTTVPMPARTPQLAYSEVEAKMGDEEVRRTKALKIVKVLHHYLGRDDLADLLAVDVGCSLGFISDELRRDGATTVGVDIDVPGLRTAHERFGADIRFVCASGEALPFPDGSVDVVVFNHIYEHVVDPDAVLDEIHRILRRGGCAYLGLGNKFQFVEPHHDLPFLSWLPRRTADRYVRRCTDQSEYYERYLSRAGLKTLVRGFTVWDYTVPVVLRPDLFGSGDQINGIAARLPAPIVRAALPIVPTYIWVATKAGGAPATAAGAGGISRLDLGATRSRNDRPGGLRQRRPRPL